MQEEQWKVPGSLNYLMEHKCSTSLNHLYYYKAGWGGRRRRKKSRDKFPSFLSHSILESLNSGISLTLTNMSLFLRPGVQLFLDPHGQIYVL